MSYGLKVLSAKGDVNLDVIDRLTRLRYTTEVTKGNEDSVTLSDITSMRSVEFSIPISGAYFAGKSHLVERSGTTLSWENPTSVYTNDYRTNSLVFLFLYT